VNHVQRLVTGCVADPETWLSCTIQLLTYCLQRARAVLASQQLPKAKLLQIYNQSRQRQEFEYFAHTVDYLFTKLCFKYLELSMFEEALFFALQLDSSLQPALLN
jgi:hypothetical protein